MESQPKIERSIKPEPGQPRMFGGTIGSAKIPWSRATEQLARARNYWIVTTRPDGQPHSRPVWGVWLADTFYFSTGSLAARNLATNPMISVHLESGSEVVIIEGIAEALSEETLTKQIVALYNEKYHWNMDAHNLPGPFYIVHPRKAFGWYFDESSITPESSALENATCWRFA